jgi:hypothetical protein
MREKKYTPSPWKVESGTIIDPHIRSTNIDDGSDDICSLNTLWVKEKRVEANAHLISAAPELLEALEEMVAECSGVELPVGLCCKITAAIAKAYGEE